jgi:uncharacterized protein (DUF1697 family)
LASWVALLRAVNLGSRNTVPMAELRSVLADAGYADVRTVIASGNVVFEASRPKAAALERLIRDAFDVTTTVILRSGAQIRALRGAQPFERDAYVAFLARRPRSTKPIEGLEPFALVGADLVIQFPNGYANAQLSGAVIERRLGIEATVRSWNTIVKLAALV